MNNEDLDKKLQAENLAKLTEADKLNKNVAVMLDIEAGDPIISNNNDDEPVQKKSKLVNFFKIIFLLVLIVYIFSLAYIAYNNKSFIEDICSTQLMPASDKQSIAKKDFYFCFVKEINKKLFQADYCSKISKPKCQLSENDIALCRTKVNLNLLKSGETEETCQLEFACPSLLADYQKLKETCLPR